MKRTISIILAAAFTLATASAQFVANGNNGYGPKDGTGYGATSGKGNGSGTCDQTGPKGSPRGGRAAEAAVSTRPQRISSQPGKKGISAHGTHSD